MKRWMPLIFVLSAVLWAQNSPDQNKFIIDMDKEIESFRFEAGIIKGERALLFVSQKSDSLYIYKRLLLASFNLKNNVGVSNYMSAILALDASASLSEREFPPQLVQRFNWQKSEQIATQQKDIKEQSLVNKPTVIVRQTPFDGVLYSLAVPGTGHLLYSKHRNKAFIYTGIGFGLLSATVFTHLDYAAKKDAYQSAVDGFDDKYDRYKSANEMRIISTAAFIAWDVFVLYDLLSENKAENSPLILQPGTNSLGFQVQF
jgi:hypothetical protein